MLRRPIEFTLDAAVRVVHEAVEVVACPGAVPDGHFEGVDGQVGSQRDRGLPADDHAGVHIDDECGVYPAGVGLDIRQVGHPEPVGCRRLEAAFDQVSGPVLALV